MNILESILVGAVQGITEFLPVSSSGHVFLIEQWLGYESSLSLIAWLHVGSLVAVIFFYRKDIFELLQGFFTMIKTKKQNPEGIYALKLTLATVLTIPLALVVKELFADNLSFITVGVTLIITGLLILVAVYIPAQEKKLSWPLVITLGIIQGLAVIPGISRSGLTIASAIILGINKKEAVRFSFLLSIPTIIGAATFLFADTGFMITTPLIIALITSALVGYGAIVWMIKLVESKWIYFAPYCFVLGLLLLYS